jgi:hypothetical protein
VCLCGARRDFNIAVPAPAEPRRAAPPARREFAPRRVGDPTFLSTMTVEIWAYVVVTALVLTAGVVTAAVSKPERIPALLGYSEPVH